MRDSIALHSSLSTLHAPRRRVVITGVGSISAHGAGGNSAVEHLLERARPAIAPIRAFSVDDSKSRLGAELPNDLLGEVIGRDEARRLSRICQLTVAACRLALEDARLESLDDASGLGLVVGSEFGDLRSTEEFAAGYLERGPVGISPMIFPNTVMNTMAAAASIAVGAKGASVTLNQQTVAGELAIARAAAMVASGRMQAVLAGGVDEIAPTLYRMLSKLGALSPMNNGPEGCWPFDRRHNGRVLGEGATFVLLEPLENALERAATIYGELKSAAWGSTPVGAHRCGSSANGKGSAIRRALAQAELSADAIGWAYLSGNGDPPLDDWQLKRLAAAFGAHQPRLTSLTPLTGDYAGLGALRVAAAARTTRTGRVAPIASLRDPVRTDCTFATGSQHGGATGLGLVHGVARGGTEIALVVAPFKA